MKSNDAAKLNSPAEPEREVFAESAPAEAVDRGMQSVVGTLRYLFFGLRILIVVLLFSFFFGAYLGFDNFGGFFYIEEHEEAMLFRFGRLTPMRTAAGETREVFGSGRAYWRWPYPIDVVRRIDTQRPVVVETRHFWPQTDPNQLDPMAAAANLEQGLRPGYDGYLLTGDTNIMHMAWRISYRVTDPKSHYLNFNDRRIGDLAPGQLIDRRPIGPEVMLRSLLEQAVLHEVANWSAEEVWLQSRLLEQQDESDLPLPIEPAFPEAGEEDEPLSPHSVEVEMPIADSPAGQQESLVTAVRTRLAAAVENAELGIQIAELALLEVQPPAPTRSAFFAVTEAAQAYRQTRDAARVYETRTLAEARSQAASTVAEGEAYKSRTIAQAAADAEVFGQILRQYLVNPDSVLVALYSDTLRNVLPLVKEQYLMPSADGISQEVRLLLGPEASRPSFED